MSSFKKYNLIFFCFLLIPLFSLCIFTYINDPYWLFHDNPKWKRLYNGHNHVLDRKSRFAKSLQVVMRQPEIIFVGSSKIYRGIPTNRYANYKIYNLGIPSMRIREAYSYIIHSVRWAPISEVVLGIDSGMFISYSKWMPGYDPSLNTYKYLFKALPSSLMTKMAYDDAKAALSGKYQDTDEGYWTISGFKVTKPMSHESLKILQSKNNMKRDLIDINKKNFNTDKLFLEEEYEEFEKILEFTNKNKINITVFIQPTNSESIERWNDENTYEQYVQWKSRILLIARKKGIPIYDLSEDNPFFNYNASNGPTQYWLDREHYSPYVGDWILKKTGLLRRLPFK